MSSFFKNPFSSKRRRGTEELELGTPDISADFSSSPLLAPDTPPNGNATLLEVASVSTPQSSPHSNEPKITLTTNDSVHKVKSRAEFFESLIKTRMDYSKGNRGSQSPTTAATTLVAARRADDFSSVGVTQATLGGLSVAAAAEALGNLRLELERAERERLAAVESLRRRTAEVENLKNIVRELSESRSAAISARASLAEQYCDLRRQHDRVSRIADLSRTVSKENVELTKAAREAAALAAKEAANARLEAQAAGQAENRAALENAMLRQKLVHLERLTLEEYPQTAGVSVCKQELVATKVIETY